MHGLVASAFLSVVLLGAAALAGARLGQASAGESDEVPPVESTQPRPAAPSSSAASVAGICDALAAAAAKNDLPPDFFARLIWQERRLRSGAGSARRGEG